MANFVFNVAKGKVAELCEAGTIRALLLKAAASDAVLKDLDTVAAVLANGSTTEADFTNYERKTLAGVNVSVNDTDDEQSVDATDPVWTSAGGASNNTLTDILIYHFVTDDAGSTPLVLLDAAGVTNGNNLTVQFGADGFFVAEDPA
jgi:uncharacterized surface protein with fasciclin (FAS1) repeats